MKDSTVSGYLTKFGVRRVPVDECVSRERCAKGAGSVEKGRVTRFRFPYFFCATFVFPLEFKLVSILARLFRRCDFELIGYVFLSGHAYSFGFQIAFLFFRPHRPAESNFAILSDDFDVVRVGREALILIDRFSNLLCNGAVRRIHLLLIRGRACLILVFLSVIWRRLLGILIPWDWGGHQRYAKNQRTQRQEQSR